MRRVTADAPIAIDELRGLVPGRFRDFIKGVVDLRRGDRSRGVDDAATREAISTLVSTLVHR
jgi:hypothetical protein